MKVTLRVCWVAAVVWCVSQSASAALVGYWPFNGTAEEETNTNIDLTLVGDAGYGASVHSGLGQSLQLGTAGGAIGQNFVKVTTDDLTIVAWAYADNLDDNWNTIIKNWGDSAGGQFHLGLGFTSTNRLQNFTPTGANVNATTDFPVGEWVHTAVVLDSVNFEHRLYMNGQPIRSVIYGGLLGPGNANITGLGIGVKTNDSGSAVSNSQPPNPAQGYWHGRLDDVGIFNHAFTDAEILDLYEKGLMGIQLDGTSEPPTNHPGDFDGDGDVDGADFVAWQTNFPKESGATLPQGDGDGDGDVDGADFVVWQTNFPFTPGPGAAPVPEPSAMLLFAIALAGHAARAWRSGRV
jgi:hypothetical protein